MKPSPTKDTDRSSITYTTVQRLRIAVFAVAAVAVTALALAAFMLFQEPEDELRGLTIVDEAGRPRIKLSSTGDVATIEMMDGNGKTKVLLRSLDDSSTIRMFHPETAGPLIELNATKASSAIGLADPDHHLSAALALDGLSMHEGDVWASLRPSQLGFARGSDKICTLGTLDDGGAYLHLDAPLGPSVTLERTADSAWLSIADGYPATVSLFDGPGDDPPITVRGVPVQLDNDRAP